MGDSVFPSLKGQGWSRTIKSVKSTLVSKSSGNQRARVNLWPYPEFHFTLDHEFLRAGDPITPAVYNDIDRLLSFHAARGRSDSFLWEDPQYKHASAVALTIDHDADADVYVCPLEVTIGELRYGITDTNGAPQIKDNGVVKTLGVHYTIEKGYYAAGFSLPVLVIKWAAQPTGPVTASFDYYFRCCFSEDEAEFTEFGANALGTSLWENKGLEFESILEVLDGGTH